MRKGDAAVMLEKKAAHEDEEKFWGTFSSKTCGKGVGRIGGLLGTVGTGWLDTGVVEAERADEVDELGDVLGADDDC